MMSWRTSRIPSEPVRNFGLVNAAKSKSYDAALVNFESARRCYERAGLGGEWADTVRHIRATHHRKAGFLADFEVVAAGAGRAAEPSFLERAKTRWGGKHGKDNS